MPRHARQHRVHGDVHAARGDAFFSVFELVRTIPRGKVMTYGQIATEIEQRLSPRAVGWAMHGCPEDVPWQRVVNASGACSTDRLPNIPTGLQRGLLESEGVEFRDNGTLDLERYRWTPPEHRPATKVTRSRKRSSTRKPPARSDACRP